MLVRTDCAVVSEGTGALEVDGRLCLQIREGFPWPCLAESIFRATNLRFSCQRSLWVVRRHLGTQQNSFAAAEMSEDACDMEPEAKETHAFIFLSPAGEASVTDLLSSKRSDLNSNPVSRPS